MTQKNTVVLLTDFGHRDGYVGVMKGVIAGIAPEAKIIDLSHDIPPQDIDAAKFVLWRHYRFFPKGTIFCCVVDPGVGTSRKILALEAEGYYFLAPDNGLLDFVMAEAKLKLMMEVENPVVMLPNQSNSFHGRDIFAPAAAHLAAGFLFTQLGPIADFTLPPSPWCIPKEAGAFSLKIMHVDHYGNIITNLKLDSLSPSLKVAEIRIGNAMIEGLAHSYGSVEEGDWLAFEASHGLLEVAVRNGSAYQQYGGKFFSNLSVKVL
ncbi:MAG: S-adenosyl-l-methionine hydroxide adenosyltransferase family protein [Bacteroidia bacterium]